MHKIDVHEVFADSHVAELADAIADDDAKRVSRLAMTVDLASKGDDGVTLVQWAILSQSPAALKALLDAGANPELTGMDGYTGAYTAALVKDPAYLELLLRHGVDPNARNREGQTPIFGAILGKRESQYEALIAAGARLDVSDSVGDTPLHIAASTNDASRVLALLRAGADPSAVNRNQATFQDYLATPNPALLNEESKRDRAAIREWLLSHNLPIKDSGS